MMRSKKAARGRSRLRKKLGHAVIETARGLGYRLGRAA